MPTPKFFKKIIERAHKDGVKFTFDDDCQVKGCKLPALWELKITHPTVGKMKLDLCGNHLKDFDNDKPFEVEMKA